MWEGVDVVEEMEFAEVLQLALAFAKRERGDRETYIVRADVFNGRFRHVESRAEAYTTR